MCVCQCVCMSIHLSKKLSMIDWILYIFCNTFYHMNTVFEMIPNHSFFFFFASSEFFNQWHYWWLYFVFKVKWLLLPNKGLLVLLLLPISPSKHQWNFSSDLRKERSFPKENGISVNQLVQGSLQTDGRVLLFLNFCHTKLVHTERHSSRITCLCCFIMEVLLSTCIH